MKRLHISENGRYFETADNKPFIWLADTCWTMPQRLKWDDAEYLMQKRKSQGFTVLQIVALDPERDELMRNPVGVPALQDGDLTKPNEAYFEYLDWIIDKATEYGFYILLLPIWGQLVVGDNWAGGVFEKTVTEENAAVFGEYIGKRYKDRSNILWCIGGDRQPIHKGVDYKPVWEELVKGLSKGLLGKALDPKKNDPKWKDLLITYHACHEMETGECSSLSYWPEETPWISFVMEQSGHGLIPKNYEIIKKDYERKTIRPVWDGEPAYEAMPTSWPPKDGGFHGTGIVRRRAYWAMLSGAFGHTYGHCVVWCSVSEHEKSSFEKDTWTSALDSEGSKQMPALRAFIEDMEPMKAEPVYDIVVGDNEELDHHVCAAINKEAKTLMVYFPDGGERLLDFAEIKKYIGKNQYGVFFDTRRGICGEPFELELDEDNQVKIVSPSKGIDNDWLLIVQDKPNPMPIHVKEYYRMESSDAKKVFEW